MARASTVPSRTHPSALFLVAALFLELAGPEPALAKPGGHLRVAKTGGESYCRATITGDPGLGIPNLGSVVLPFAGGGFAAFDDHELTVEDALAAPSVDLYWEVNQLFASHPLLGFLRARLNPAQVSTVEVIADDPSGPLFPATLTTELFFEIDLLDMPGMPELFTTEPLTMEGAATNLGPGSFDPVGEYHLQAPVALYAESGGQTVQVGTIDAADITVREHQGLQVELVSATRYGKYAVVVWELQNLQPGSQEVFLYGADSNDLVLISTTLGPPHNLSLPDAFLSEPFTLSGDPLSITQVAEITGPLDGLSCVFVGANNLEFADDELFDSSIGMITGDQVVDVIPLPPAIAPAVPRWALLAASILVLGAAAFLWRRAPPGRPECS